MTVGRLRRRNRTASELPTSRHPITGREAFGLAAILLLALALRAITLANSAAQDDAYITYRYAQNLADSHGLVYNVGERVLGTTTPLFALLLAALAWAGLSPESTAPVLGVVFDLLLCGIGWYFLHAHAQKALAWLWAIAYATFYVPLQSCANGMETQLFTLLVFAAIASHESDHDIGTGILIGLAMLVRPEGVLLPALFAGDRLLLKRAPIRSLLAPALAALAVVVPWMLVATAYYGSAMPNSVVAKRLTASAPIAAWFDFFFSRNALMAGLWAGFAVGLVPAVRLRARWSWLWLGWTVLYALFFLVARPPFFGPWYLLPAIPGLLLGAVMGADVLAAWLLRAATPRRIAIGCAWVVVMALLFPRYLDSMRSFKHAMHVVYRPMAAWIRDRTTADATVFASDIGYIGWISERRILDGAGLVSPQASTYYRDHAHDRLAAVYLVLRERPQLVVVSTPAPPLEDWSAIPEFTAAYAQAIRFRLHGDDPKASRSELDPDYTIFARREP